MFDYIAESSFYIEELSFSTESSSFSIEESSFILKNHHFLLNNLHFNVKFTCKRSTETWGAHVSNPLFSVHDPPGLG